MEAEELEKINGKFKQATDLQQEIEEITGAKCLTLFTLNEPINRNTTYRMHKVLRNMESVEKLDLFLNSGGGDLDSTAKITDLLSSKCVELRCVVPFYAKSAATLIALSADEIVMCEAGELGVVDPIVKHPAVDQWIPARSIDEALRYLESIDDQIVKLRQADKLDPYLIGAYKDASSATREVLRNLFQI